MHLREVVTALRQRCAPARDPDLDAIEHGLDGPPSGSEAAKVVVGTVRSILKVAEAMKNDLSQFVLGTMGEGQLKAAIREQAKVREREIVVEVWNKETIAQEWKDWMGGPDEVEREDEGAVRRRYLERLMKALCGATPVFCSLPTKTIPLSPPSSEGPQQEPSIPIPNPNKLPPILFFSVPELVSIQNFLQMIVIAACLRALLPSSAVSATSPSLPDASGSSSTSFTSRIVTLLLASIDAPADDSTKLINLADELVRANGHSLSPESEKKLREAVDRTLRLQDPVFSLLQQRLSQAILDRILRHSQEQVGAGTKRAIDMRTGRDVKGKRIRIGLDGLAGSFAQEDDVDVWDGIGEAVKGFEDPELGKRVDEVTKRVEGVLRWVDEVWGEEMPIELGLRKLAN